MHLEKRHWETASLKGDLGLAAGTMRELVLALYEARSQKGYQEQLAMGENLGISPEDKSKLRNEIGRKFNIPTPEDLEQIASEYIARNSHDGAVINSVGMNGAAAKLVDDMVDNGFDREEAIGLVLEIYPIVYLKDPNIAKLDSEKQNRGLAMSFEMLNKSLRSMLSKFPENPYK